MPFCLRRREFIAALGGAAAWQLAARAQPAAMPVIAVLWLGGPSDPNIPPISAAFRRHQPSPTVAGAGKFSRAVAASKARTPLARPEAPASPGRATAVSKVTRTETLEMPPTHPASNPDRWRCLVGWYRPKPTPTPETAARPGHRGELSQYNPQPSWKCRTHHRSSVRRVEIGGQGGDRDCGTMN
jgi:hypothetical protein